MRPCPASLKPDCASPAKREEGRSRFSGVSPKRYRVYRHLLNKLTIAGFVARSLDRRVSRSYFAAHELNGMKAASFSGASGAIV